MKTLNLIGAGRVGQTLGHLFHAAGVYRVQSVLTRNQSSAEHAAKFIGAGQPFTQLADMPAADVWMLGVPDAQIAPVAAALAQLEVAQLEVVQRPALVFHCSGALGSAELAPLQQRGWQIASAHCLLSFAQPATAIQQFGGTPCALEGDAQALLGLETAFRQLGAQCFTLAAQHKLLYHAGAVFATNFLPVLQNLAEQLWQHSGMPDALAQQMRATLLQNAVNNIVILGPKAALTGPAARGDTALVAAQCMAVAQWNPVAGVAYQALSTLAAKLAKS